MAVMSLPEQPGLLCWPRFPPLTWKRRRQHKQTNKQTHDPAPWVCRCPWLAQKNWKKMCFINSVFIALSWIHQLVWTAAAVSFKWSIFFVQGSQMRTTAPHHLHLSWENTDKQVTEILSQVIGHLSVWEILQCNIILCKSQTVNNRSQAI